VIGFDINAQGLAELLKGHDCTRETNQQEVQAQADVFIMTLQSPIYSAKRPDLSPLDKARH